MIKLDNIEIKQKHFPDGTLHIKYEQGCFPNENVIEGKINIEKILKSEVREIYGL